jgi:formylglycine-generating enzyme required for sulfatase activity
MKLVAFHTVVALLFSHLNAVAHPVNHSPGQAIPRGAVQDLSLTRSVAQLEKEGAERRQSIGKGADAELPRSVFQILSPDCDVCPSMVRLAPGSYLRGAPETEREPFLAAGGSLVWFNGSLPQKVVSITKPVAIGRYEVTQAQWEAVMGSNPSHFHTCGPDCPVDNVSWDDVQIYIRRLNERTGNRLGFRLPSEAEWEYAARAGTTTAFYTGDTLTPGQANFNGRLTTKVGSYPPNPWQLHDMLGNLWELTQDCYEVSYNRIPTDESAWEPEQIAKNCMRTMRGGAWNSSSAVTVVRVAYRLVRRTDMRSNDTGFRLARTIF